MIQQLGTADLKECDDMIIDTDKITGELVGEAANLSQDGDPRAIMLANGVERLCGLWNEHRRQDEQRIALQEDTLMGIGPDENHPIYHSAVYLTTLLLSLRHPPLAKGKQSLALSRLNRPLPTSRTEFDSDTPYNPAAYPKILLSWLNENHNPYDAALSEVLTQKPSPAAHPDYWDMLLMSVVRGNFLDVIRMLKRSNFLHAVTAKGDGSNSPGYRGTQLQNTQSVIKRAIEVFEASPILTEDNWHVTRNEWIMFRRLVEKTLNDLTTFAEGRDKDHDEQQRSFEVGNFGLGSFPKEMSTTSRRAESRVPWTIFQNLKTVYGILLGGSNEILSSVQDWVEATLALTAWWPGDDDDDLEASVFGRSARFRSVSKSRGTRLVDHDARHAYLRRLSAAFERVLDESDEGLLLPDSTKPLEIALASIFEGSVDGIIGFLKGFSLLVADAVVEIAGIGGWLNLSDQSAIPDGFDESDLMVLSNYSPVKMAPLRDQVMTLYADTLFTRGVLKQGVAGKIDGWELAIAVIARMTPGNDGSSKRRIEEYLDKLPHNSDAQIDKILETCRKYQMVTNGHAIVEVSDAAELDPQLNTDFELEAICRLNIGKFGELRVSTRVLC